MRLRIELASRIDHYLDSQHFSIRDYLEIRRRYRRAGGTNAGVNSYITTMRRQPCSESVVQYKLRCLDDGFKFILSDTSMAACYGPGHFRIDILRLSLLVQLLDDLFDQAEDRITSSPNLLCGFAPLASALQACVSRSRALQALNG